MCEYRLDEVEMAISRKVRVVALILSLCLLLVIAAKTAIAFSRYTKAEKSFASVQVGTLVHPLSGGWESQTITRRNVA